MKPIKMRKAGGFRKTPKRKTISKEDKKRNLTRWSMEKRLS